MESAAMPPYANRREGKLANRGFTRVAHARRYSEIVAVLVKYGFVDVVDAMHLRPYLTAGRRILSVLGRDGHPEENRAVRLRLTFEELGPTFIKVGQALSTRSDLLPPEVIAQLTLLRDQVPPLPPGTAERAIQEALGRSIPASRRSSRPTSRSWPTSPRWPSATSLTLPSTASVSW